VLKRPVTMLSLPNVIPSHEVLQRQSTPVEDLGHGYGEVCCSPPLSHTLPQVHRFVLHQHAATALLGLAVSESPITGPQWTLPQSWRSHDDLHSVRRLAWTLLEAHPPTFDAIYFIYTIFTLRTFYLYLARFLSMLTKSAIAPKT